ncbi:MAG: hypothetical protein WKG07_11665 [Hymenobacter sp.]
MTLDSAGRLISDQQPTRVSMGPGVLAARKRNFVQATPAYELTGKKPASASALGAHAAATLGDTAEPASAEPA